MKGLVATRDISILPSPVSSPLSYEDDSTRDTRARAFCIILLGSSWAIRSQLRTLESIAHARFQPRFLAEFTLLFLVGGAREML